MKYLLAVLITIGSGVLIAECVLEHQELVYQKTRADIAEHQVINTRSKENVYFSYWQQTLDANADAQKRIARLNATVRRLRAESDAQFQFDQILIHQLLDKVCELSHNSHCTLNPFAQ